MGTKTDRGTRNGRGGFTLIELAIVITIIGIFVGAIAHSLTTYVIKLQQEKLTAGIADVQEALRDFIAADDGTGTDNANGRYPCPASLTAKPSDADFGLEKRDPVTGLCQAGSGITVVAGTAGQNVYIGTVPTKTLAIGRKYMLDPWHSRFTYAVSENLVANGQPLADTRIKGAITIEGNGTTITNEAHFAIISHGLDQAGAYTANGTPNVNACRVGNGDAENCDDDAVFASLERAEAQGMDFFDDGLSFTLQNDDPNGWLAVTLATPANIHNLNTGNLGIGTNDPNLSH